MSRRRNLQAHGVRPTVGERIGDVNDITSSLRDDQSFPASGHLPSRHEEKQTIEKVNGQRPERKEKMKKRLTSTLSGVNLF